MQLTRKHKITAIFSGIGIVITTLISNGDKIQAGIDAWQKHEDEKVVLQESIDYYLYIKPKFEALYDDMYSLRSSYQRDTAALRKIIREQNARIDSMNGRGFGNGKKALYHVEVMSKPITEWFTNHGNLYFDSKGRSYALIDNKICYGGRDHLQREYWVDMRGKHHLIEDND